MAERRTDPAGATRGTGAVRPDRGGNRDQSRNDRPDRDDVAHWGQYTLDGDLVNTCDGLPWVKPAPLALVCPRCVRMGEVDKWD
jgi:hypothetical protein